MVLIVRSLSAENKELDKNDKRTVVYKAVPASSTHFNFTCDENARTRQGPVISVEGELVHSDGVEADSKAEANLDLGSLPTSVQSHATSRRSVMIINRGTPASDSCEFFPVLVDRVLQSISQSAERALQIVADEIAKEKQMQRLLVGEQDTSPQQIIVPAKADEKAADTPATYTPRSTKDLSLPLRQALKSASLKREERTTGRFAIYSSNTEYLLPIPQHDRVLTARGFDAEAFSDFETPRRTANSSLDESDLDNSTSVKRSRQQMRRRSSTWLQEKLLNQHPDLEPVVPLKGNGWGEEVLFYEFDGSSSFMQLPSIPGLESVIKGFVLDFWLSTDCRLKDGRKILLHVGDGSRSDIGMCLSLGLNWYTDLEDGMRLYIRDASNRVLECIIPFEDDTNNGDFHHIQIRLLSLEECRVDAYIDGVRNGRIRFLQTEHPGTFNKWVSMLYLGAMLNDAGQPINVLRGAIIELRLWELNARRPLMRWPLHGQPNPNGSLVESMGTITPEHQTNLHRLRQVVRAAPAVVPLFDGTTVVNMGPLNMFGDFLNHWGFEVTFRTQVTNKSMSLLGVTDSQHKQMKIALILNAEPTVKEEYRLHEYTITFILGDCNGSTMSALIRGSERNHVMDGRWHTLSLKVVDSEQCRIDVRIDNLPREVIPVVRNSPKVFCELRDWVCIGGHNVRGWKVQNQFEGQIKSCSFQVRGEDFARLEMREGPGALLFQDQTGRHNHGLLLDTAHGENRKHTMFWIPYRDTSQEEGGQTQTGAKERGESHSGVTIHKNNRVSCAVVKFGGIATDGRFEEQVWDMLNQQSVELTESLASARDDGDGRHFGSWITLPDTAFKMIESVPVMRDMITNAVNEAALKEGHTLVICRIGDCYISLLNVSGPHYYGNVTFDSMLAKWVPHTVSTDGLLNKRMQLLNDMTNALQKCLMEMTSIPNIVNRLGPVNQPNHRVTATALYKYFTDSGMRWRLPLVVQALLMNVEYSSTIHFVDSITDECTEDDALSVARFHDVLREEAKERAAIFIQRNWRGKLARNRVIELIELKRIRKIQVEEIMAVRKTNPMVLPKKAMRAMIIMLREYSCTLLGTLPDALIADDVVTALSKQGYQIDLVKNPTRPQLIKALSMIEADSNMFVYICGYGGKMQFRAPPHFSVDHMTITISEEAARADIELEFAVGFNVLFNKFLQERQIINEVLAAKPVKKKKAKTPRPPSRAKPKQNAAEEEARKAILLEATSQREELERAELEVREREIASLEDTARLGLHAELLKGLRAINDYIRKNRPVYCIFPSDVAHIEPYYSEALLVEELLSRALLRPVPPMGFQCVVAIDLVSPSDKVPGAAFLASSTTHSFTFDYRPCQRYLLSWTLEKALNGHAKKLPLKTKDAYLIGATDTPAGACDWRSFATYVAPRVQTLCGGPSAPIEKMLAMEVPYTADVVPLRTIPYDDEARERRRRERDMKRVISSACIAVENSKVMPDMMHEFRPLLRHTNITDILPLPSILFTFTQYPTSIDSLNLDSFSAEVHKLIPGFTFTLTLSCDGLLLEGPRDPAEKAKTLQQLQALANKSHHINLSLHAYAAKQFITIDNVMMLFNVKVSTTLRKHRQQFKEYLGAIACPHHIKFLSYGVEKM